MGIGSVQSNNIQREETMRTTVALIAIVLAIGMVGCSKEKTAASGAAQPAGSGTKVESAAPAQGSATKAETAPAREGSGTKSEGSDMKHGGSGTK